MAADRKLERFGKAMSEEEVSSIINEQIPQNTRNHANWAMKTFNEWRKNRIESNITNSNVLQVFNDPEVMTKEDLNYMLKFFIHEVRRLDGQKYPRNILKQIFAGIQYYFRNILGKSFSLFTDAEFLDARKSLDAAMKLACQENRGVRKRKANVISPEDESLLWERGILGEDFPAKLNRTLIYIFALQLGLRGGTEIRNLTVGVNGMISLRTAVNGLEEYILFEEQFSKTFRGGLRDSHLNAKEIKIFENTVKEKCPIRLFKKYLSIRQKNGKCDAMFLTPLRKPTATQWYADSPLGKNTLGSTVKNLMEMAKIDGDYTNQSCRRTAVTRIISATKDPAMARSITGHRSAAVLDYDESATSEKRRISDILQSSHLPGLSMVKTKVQKTSKKINDEIEAVESENEKENTDDEKEKPIMFRISKRDVTIEFSV